MYNQSNRERFRKLGTKALDSSLVIDNQGIGRSVDYGRKTKFKTDFPIDTPDSLQLFQEEINSVLKGARKKKSENRNATTVAGRSIPVKQTMEIKGQLNKMKNMLQSQTELKLMEDRLQKLLVQLQTQKGKQQSRVTQQFPIIVPPQQSPFMMQQPMYPQYQYPQYPQYPPPIYYPPPPSYYTKPRRKKRKDYDDDSEESEDGFRPKKSRRDPKNKTQGSSRSRYPGNSRQRIRTRLRIYLFAVLFTKFLKSEAKKLSTVRKTNLKRFWTEKFQSQIQNLKNWLLDTQKFSLAIILQKKHLNLVFFDDKSERVRDQKKKLIMQIIGIGVNKILQDATPQKISLFSEILLNLCRKGSFAVSRFWTVSEMEQICISQYFGFFRIDTEQQKFLIGLLVFIKVFVFNMFLQPYKFDSNNFPKKQEPTTTNMKLISSAYYLMIKDIINQYRDHQRDTNIYKVGNWLEVKKQFIVQCSEPVIFGNGYPQEGEYISGLFTAEQLSELRDFETWESCSNKMKTVIDKLHCEMLAKGKMVKKNLKYKLYN